jgi:hypothetical protein
MTEAATNEVLIIIALTYGRESQWVQNVIENDGCKLEIRGTALTLG